MAKVFFCEIILTGDLVGIVLAGGQSSRLGEDKALLTLYPHSSQTLLERTVSLLRSFVQVVWVSGRQTDYAPFLPDAVQSAGPIGGLIAALRVAKGKGCCVLACDLPLLRACHLARLLATREQYKDTACVTAFQNASGRFEATVAVYEQAALPYLQQAAKRKQYALHKAIPSDQWFGIPYKETEASAFLNLNTPEDLKKVRFLLQEEV